MKPVRQLKLSIEELEAAFESITPSSMDAMAMGFLDELPGSFLNLTTGAVVTPEDVEDADAWLNDENLLLLPDDLFEDLNHGSLDEFVASLPDGALRDELAQVICGKGAFRRFKDIVFGGGNVELKHQWKWHETRRMREKIVKWLEDEAIIPDWGCDIFEAPPLPGKRADLLRAVLDFVRAARELPVVRRIALIGSLATDKAIPKDIDLLVCVNDGEPLEDLARLSRRLSGAAMATGDGCGADVFILNPKGEYLGRICNWKQCAPGIRAACMAQHCGRRHYLHDDLQVIRLDATIIKAPPLELWPEIIARAEMPGDVRWELIAHLA